MYFIFFFFKQKTAYEMRISDWSSDVCSSDLYDGRDQATTVTISGGGTPDTLATVIASGPAFVASNVGDDVVLDYDGEPVRIRITALESASKVFGYPSRALTAADLSPTEIGTAHG